MNPCVGYGIFSYEKEKPVGLVQAIVEGGDGGSIGIHNEIVNVINVQQLSFSENNETCAQLSTESFEVLDTK